MATEQRNIRLIVAYDGTELNGYQSQVNGITVQDCLEAALTKVCNEPISIYGASRTDAGVHAKFQVVTVFYNRACSRGKPDTCFNCTFTAFYCNSPGGRNSVRLASPLENSREGIYLHYSQ